MDSPLGRGVTVQTLIPSLSNIIRSHINKKAVSEGTKKDNELCCVHRCARHVTWHFAYFISFGVQDTLRLVALS
jgi:hypothetical protein